MMVTDKVMMVEVMMIMMWMVMRSARDEFVCEGGDDDDEGGGHEVWDWRQGRRGRAKVL